MPFKMKGKWGEDTVSLAQKLCEEGVVGKGREGGGRQKRAGGAECFDVGFYGLFI